MVLGEEQQTLVLQWGAKKEGGGVEIYIHLRVTEEENSLQGDRSGSRRVQKQRPQCH